jgi:hypothetical protein
MPAGHQHFANNAMKLTPNHSVPFRFVRHQSRSRYVAVPDVFGKRA